MTGLSAGVPYTFAVVATNAAGQSLSAASPATVVAEDDLSVVVAPAQDVVDGEALSVKVTRASASLSITQVFWAWCLDDALLPQTQATTTSENVLVDPSLVDSEDCTDDAISSYAPTLPSEFSFASPINSSNTYPTDTGTVIAQTGSVTSVLSGTSSGITCGFGNPCDLGLSVQSGSGPYSYSNFAVPVEYANPSLQSFGCPGGLAPNALQTEGPDPMNIWAVPAWVRGYCASDATDSGGLSPVASSDSLSEGGVTGDIQAFASGVDDLVYSAVGYGVSGFTPSVARPYVAVPVALNAVVLGLGSNYSGQSSTGGGGWFSYPSTPPPTITLSEAARFLGNCSQPSPLTVSVGGSTVYLDTQVLAETGSWATNYFATNFFDTTDPSDWNTGTWVPGGQCPSDGDSDVPLGVTSDFATANPTYNVSGYTGYKTLQKDLWPPNLATALIAGNPGPIWALTDAATAAQTWGGLVDLQLQAPASVGSATPVYVGPTEEAMDAAVADMVPQTDSSLVGPAMLLPNPNAAPATSGPLAGVQPYPLTFVEYALVPAEPLLSASCTLDTSKQQLLTKWLNYITGQGQAELPEGMEPLTAGLEADAQQAIAAVGQSPETNVPGFGPDCVPGAPTDVTATSSGQGSASISWTAPSDTGGSAITDYKILVTPFGGSTNTIDVGSSATSYQLSGLTEADLYTLEVEAVNGQFTGAPSATAIVAFPLATTTTTPSGFVLTPTATTIATGPTTSTGSTTSTTGPPFATSKDFGTMVSGVLGSGSPLTLTASVGGANATVVVPAGALPAGTAVYLVPVSDGAAFSRFLPASQSYLVAFAVMWQAPDGTSPDASLPITLSITDSSIQPGDTVYEMTGQKPAAIGTTESTGTVTIPFETDPFFIIGEPRTAPAPPATLGTGPLATLTGTATTTLPLPTTTSSLVTLPLPTTTSSLVTLPGPTTTSSLVTLPGPTTTASFAPVATTTLPTATTSVPTTIARLTGTTLASLPSLTAVTSLTVVTTGTGVTLPPSASTTAEPITHATVPLGSSTTTPTPSLIAVKIPPFGGASSQSGAPVLAAVVLILLLGGLPFIVVKASLRRNRRPSSATGGGGPP